MPTKPQVYKRPYATHYFTNATDKLPTFVAHGACASKRGAMRAASPRVFVDRQYDKAVVIDRELNVAVWTLKITPTGNFSITMGRDDYAEQAMQPNHLRSSQMTRPLRLDQIDAKIEELKAQKAAMLARERNAVLAQVREAINTYALTVKELTAPEAMLPLELAAQTDLERKRSERGAAMSARVKYKLGDDKWSGFGHQPRWVQAYLAESKKHKLEDLLQPEFQTHRKTIKAA